MMRVYNHIVRAEHIEATLRKLNLEDDYEMVIENCMLALTHYYCAALHVEGVTPVFFNPPHVNNPPLHYFRRSPSQELKKAIEHLKYIEKIRNPHLRGLGSLSPSDIVDVSYDPNIVQKCLKCFDKGKTIFLNIIAEQVKKPEWLPQNEC
jgi:hypothetical protein